MFSAATVLLVIFAYMTLLFLVAHYAEGKERAGKSLVSNPYIYSLSLAVYCTSWTFYGSVGKAANSGLSFLTTYLGPTLIASLWWIVLRKIVQISKENRITTISDLIATRYGKSLFLSALVTVVAVVGITPYLGLQLKAIISTFVILTGRPEGSSFAGWFIAPALGVFAIVFGARRLYASERHGGLVFAVAFESAIKLVAFMAVGVFVTYGIYDGFGDIFTRFRASEFSRLMTIGEGAPVGFLEWTSLTFLSMMAIMFLPRQFHVSVVENSSTEHIKKAMWLFPLYLVLINIFVVPIAYGGLLLGGEQSAADYFVLSIPMKQGYPMLALLAFIGGFSAATAMIIVESLALSTMVMNSLVTPVLLKMKTGKGLYSLVLNIKRLVIILLVFLGYTFAIYIGESYSLVDIGLKSFEAVTIFAPAVLLGLYWKGGNSKGAIAGISAGFLIWIYTLLVPALARAGLLEKGGVIAWLHSSKMLNPTALFGLEGLDRWSHSLFWGLLLNVLLYVGVSLFTRQSEVETRQAIIFVDAYSPSKLAISRRPERPEEIVDLLTNYLGPYEARSFMDGFYERNGLQQGELSDEALHKLRSEAEMLLAAAMGPSISTIIFEDRTVLTVEEKKQLSDSIKNISRNLRLSRQELSDANRKLAQLKDFSENIIESIPLGVATMNASREIRSWNRAMEEITGVSRSDAIGRNAEAVLKCIEPAIFTGLLEQSEFNCHLRTGAQAVLKGYLSELTGAALGYVLVFEDVTEKKKIEEELFRTTKHASIGRLAAGVSHEIGNPLASISSISQELLAEDVTPDVREAVDTINQQVHRISRIVRNLGDFARLQPRQKSPSDLKGILEKTINLVRFNKEFKNIEIEMRADDIGLVKVDADQMQQVFLNLMLNAKDVMPEGGRITIDLRRSNGAVEMVFSDTGPGVDSDLRSKVFDPFFTTKGPAKGTGLGLSICYSIIKDHGGTIEVDAANGGGASFIIRIPVEG